MFILEVRTFSGTGYSSPILHSWHIEITGALYEYCRWYGSSFGCHIADMLKCSVAFSKLFFQANQYYKCFYFWSQEKWEWRFFLKKMEWKVIYINRMNKIKCRSLLNKNVRRRTAVVPLVHVTRWVPCAFCFIIQRCNRIDMHCCADATEVV